jgi:hypothetical protein
VTGLLDVQTRVAALEYCHYCSYSRFAVQKNTAELKLRNVNYSTMWGQTFLSLLLQDFRNGGPPL